MKKFQHTNVLLGAEPGDDTLAKHDLLVIDSYVQTATFSDAQPHVLAEFAVRPGRTIYVQLLVTAHDDAGARVAFPVPQPILNVTRFASGPILVDGSPLPYPILLTYAPAPGIGWLASIVESAPGRIGVEVIGLATPSLHWRATFLVFGTQVK